MEPLLQPSARTYVTFPIRYAKMWKLYKQAVASFWTAEEISFSDKDKTDWERLTADEQFYIKQILAFFAASDGIVMENLGINFGEEVQVAEARSFYAYQAFNESIHSETYSLLIDSIVSAEEKDQLFNALEDIPWVTRKAAWAKNYFDRSKSFAERLVAFACVEGILFSSSFCGIFWLMKRGLMPALTLSNDFIARDENLHCEFAVELYNCLERRLDEATVKSIVAASVDVECDFVTNSLPSDLIGLNYRLVCNYVKFCADRLVRQLGYTNLYNAENPFEWMVGLGMSSKTNFFEQRENSYQKLGVMDGNSVKISFDAEF